MLKTRTSDVRSGCVLNVRCGCMWLQSEIHSPFTSHYSQYWRFDEHTLCQTSAYGSKTHPRSNSDSKPRPQIQQTRTARSAACAWARVLVNVGRWGWREKHATHLCRGCRKCTSETWWCIYLFFQMTFIPNDPYLPMNTPSARETVYLSVFVVYISLVLCIVRWEPMNESMTNCCLIMCQFCHCRIFIYI